VPGKEINTDKDEKLTTYNFGREIVRNIFYLSMCEEILVELANVGLALEWS
jgi:hypothetical protein